MYGWMIGKNMELEHAADWKEEKREGYQYAARLLCKFPGDIVNAVSPIQDCFLDGYVGNKGELVRESEAKTWESAFVRLCGTGSPFAALRGSFGGFVVCRAPDGDKVTLYTDHMGSKAVYYYQDATRLAASSDLGSLAKTLRKNGIACHLDENAVRYMLTYGFMVDDTTFIREVKRVLPGQSIIWKGGTAEKATYYLFDNTATENWSREEAIEQIDAAFRQAIRREFEKDREYGYRHLVDLSGGLDSRMVCWVAHELGYTDQVNFTYCRSNYLDHAISEKIAMDLKHEYLFKPLDDAQWLYDIDEIVQENNGAALYHGITGGKRFLSLLNPGMFGIEHTGMVGDVIPSSFYGEERTAYGKPAFGMHQYSNRLHYDFDPGILSRFPNQEIFALYVRGLLGAASSYIIRQNYFETGSAFLDVDFLNTCLKMPFSYRAKHSIYLDWIEKKYPQAAEYGWEKWGGVKPKKSHIKYRRVVTSVRLADHFVKKLLGKPQQDNMNPLDYWYGQDKRLQEYYQEYFDRNIGKTQVSDDLRKDMERLFREGNASEKGMVLTILGAVKNYL